MTEPALVDAAYVGVCLEEEVIAMTTVSIFRNRSNQAIRIPKSMEFEGVTELEVNRVGDVLTLRPVRPTWASFTEVPAADDDFLAVRPTVVAPRPVFEEPDE